MASPKNMRQEPSLPIIHNLMRGLEWNREYRHSRAQGDATPQYMEIREDVNHHRGIETELKALATSTRGSKSSGLSGVTAGTSPTSALASTKRKGRLKIPAPPALAKAATTREPPPWAT